MPGQQVQLHHQLLLLCDHLIHLLSLLLQSADTVMLQPGHGGAIDLLLTNGAGPQHGVHGPVLHQAALGDIPCEPDPALLLILHHHLARERVVLPLHTVHVPTRADIQLFQVSWQQPLHAKHGVIMLELHQSTGQPDLKLALSGIVVSLLRMMSVVSDSSRSSSSFQYSLNLATAKI